MYTNKKKLSLAECVEVQNIFKVVKDRKIKFKDEKVDKKEMFSNSKLFKILTISLCDKIKIQHLRRITVTF